MDSENIIHWKSVTDNPPPPEVFVWLTNWKSFGLGKRVSVKKGNKDDLLWNYKDIMLHDAIAWCKKEEFETVVFNQ